jgi:SAM-dependent methyltransferase
MAHPTDPPDGDGDGGVDMTDVLLELLACPTCQGALRAGPRGTASDTLDCLGCGLTVPVVNGIPRFVQTDGYAGSFSVEWTRFSRTQLDSATGGRRSEQRFQQSFDWPLAELRGKVVLDAGCGMGRFAEVAARYGATVIGVDLSYAVDAAARNLTGWDRVAFVQADLRRLPFRKAAFDVIYSLGVLHHTPNPRATFSGLVELLKPGGRISVTVYSGYNRVYIGSTELWRRLTTKLPTHWVYALSRLAIPLYHVYRLPLVGWLGKVLWPISLDENPEWRVLDTFDCYTPRYQFYATHHEVYQWFREAGLTQIGVLEPGVSLIGTRPVPNGEPGQPEDDAVGKGRSVTLP